MAIILNDNLKINAGKPIDSRYLTTGNTVYISTGATNSAIPVSLRYTGLTVNILGIEYWYKTGVADINLVEKTNSKINPANYITGATNGIIVSGQVVKLGGIITGSTTLTLTGTSALIFADNRTIKVGIQYAGDYSSGFTANSLITKGYALSLNSTSASGQRITKLICKTSHGFCVNEVIGWSGGTYNRAIANGTYDGEVIGIVTKNYNANCFDLTQAGYVTGLTSLCNNTTYFLSDVCAGLITSIEPTTDQHISKSVLLANSSTSGWVLPYAGYVINSGSSCGTLIKSVCFPSTSTYFMTTNDFFVGAKSGDTIILPSSPQCGMVVVVADVSDQAGSGGSVSVIGALANGQSQSLINTDSGSLTYIYNGCRWNVIGFVSTPVPV